MYFQEYQLALLQQVRNLEPTYQRDLYSAKLLNQVYTQFKKCALKYFHGVVPTEKPTIGTDAILVGDPTGVHSYERIWTLIHRPKGPAHPEAVHFLEGLWTHFAHACQKLIETIYCFFVRELDRAIKFTCKGKLCDYQHERQIKYDVRYDRCTGWDTLKLGQQIVFFNMYKEKKHRGS